MTTTTATTTTAISCDCHLTARWFSACTLIPLYDSVRACVSVRALWPILRWERRASDARSSSIDLPGRGDAKRLEDPQVLLVGRLLSRLRLLRLGVGSHPAPPSLLPSSSVASERGKPRPPSRIYARHPPRTAANNSLQGVETRDTDQARLPPPTSADERWVKRRRQASRRRRSKRIDPRKQRLAVHSLRAPSFAEGTSGCNPSVKGGSVFV